MGLNLVPMLRPYTRVRLKLKVVEQEVLIVIHLLLVSFPLPVNST